MGGANLSGNPGGAPGAGPSSVGGASGRHQASGPAPSLKSLRALVERLGHGVTPEELALASELGHEAYLERHLRPDTIDDAELDARLAAYPTLTMSVPEIVALDGAVVPHSPAGDLRYATVLRAVTSKRQLFERLVDTWSDHLSVQHVNATLVTKTVDDRDVIRAHALGRFGDMVHASARSAAMLEYLDNQENTKAGPNENYARELMELHTLGVDGGYTEADVKEAARALTGWRYEETLDGPAPVGDFVFSPDDHDVEAKSVLGFDLPPGQGIEDGDQLLDLLVAHPSTAVFIARKLATRLLVDDPPTSVVQRAGIAFRQTGGDLRATTRAVLSPASFAEAKPWAAPKFRRPFHFAASLLRVTGAELIDPEQTLSTIPIVEVIRVLGQAPFEWPTPDGYPDGPGAWSGTLTARWTFASKLLADSLPGVSLDVDRLVGEVASSAATIGWGRAIGERLVPGGFSSSDVAVLDDYVAAAPSPTRVAEAIALGASSPSFQWY